MAGIMLRRVSEPVRRPMTADDFIAWAMERPEGENYELSGGEAVAMAPERVGHNLLKFRIARKLAEAIEASRLDCLVLTDGVSLRTNGSTVYEPDAMVRCGPRLDPQALEISDPLLVLEVISRSTRGVDRGRKLRDYFRLYSLQHHLIADYVTGSVLHHQRKADGQIVMTIIGNGEVQLDPPGITIRYLFSA